MPSAVNDICQLSLRITEFYFTKYPYFVWLQASISVWGLCCSGILHSVYC